MYEINFNKENYIPTSNHTYIVLEFVISKDNVYDALCHIHN